MRKHIVIGILSASMLAYQLVIMQLLSMAQWHHFGFMIISVAMLGFGAAGTYLSLLKQKKIKQWTSQFPWFILLTGISMLLVVPLTQSPAIRFDSYLVFVSPLEKVKLLLNYLLYFFPFFTGALAIGLYFITQKEKIGRAYFVNLIGSAIGSALIVGIMWWIKPEHISVGIALLVLVAAMLEAPLVKKKMYYAVLFPGLLLGIILMVFMNEHKISEYKSLSAALLLPDTKVVNKGFSPYGTFHEVKSPAMRHAPGLSLNYHASLPAVNSIYINGNFKGAFSCQQISDSAHYLTYSIYELPYRLKTPKKTLLLGGAEGTHLSLALHHQCENILTVDPDPLALDWIKSSAKACDASSQSKLRFQMSELRSFVMRDTSQYDLITLPTVGSFGGVSGINAIQEDYLLTIESISSLFQKLSHEGMLVVATYMDNPGRYSYRLLATLAQSLSHVNIEHPGQHIVAIRNWNAIIYLVSRKPIKDSSLVTRFCDAMCFDPVLFPGMENSTDACNTLPDKAFPDNIDKILASDDAFIDNYEFRINAPDDQQPFFHQFIKWDSLHKMKDTLGQANLPFFELGYYIILFTFLQTVIIAFVLIMLPLLFRKIQSKSKFRILVYFSSLGLGYMFLEIVFIHQFILYFGNAIYATAATISMMMMFSGLGSYYSERWLKNNNRWMIVLLTISILVMLLQFGSMNLLKQTIGFSIWIKLPIALSLLAPVSFAMGMPFPTGIKRLCHDDGSLAWAWGINGYFSVISVPLASILAVEMGYNWVFVLVSFFYLLALLSLKMKR
ncbi:MAG: hypothetical protein K9G70_13750 [Prolixibacteraceae bacterium]|nr:hypothetical protein [Prolixibacteraceae bacterium]